MVLGQEQSKISFGNERGSEVPDESTLRYACCCIVVGDKPVAVTPPFNDVEGNTIREYIWLTECFEYPLNEGETVQENQFETCPESNHSDGYLKFIKAATRKGQDPPWGGGIPQPGVQGYMNASMIGPNFCPGTGMIQGSSGVLRGQCKEKLEQPGCPWYTGFTVNWDPFT